MEALKTLLLLLTLFTYLNFDIFIILYLSNIQIVDNSSDIMETSLWLADPFHFSFRNSYQNFYNLKDQLCFKTMKKIRSELEKLLAGQMELGGFYCKAKGQFIIKLLLMGSNWTKIVKKRFEEERGRLDLSLEEIRDKDILDIVQACQEVKNKIKDLDLFSKNIGEEGAKHLSAANFPNLIYLELGQNKIGAEGAKYLSTVNFPNLTGMNLWKNNIGAEGAKYLSVANYPNLTQLYLGYNKIQAEGAKHLSSANFPNLKKLYLNNNKIRAEGVKYLSTAYPNLTVLFLWQNEIGANGAKYLSVANYPNLTVLNLDNNNIRAEGAKYLSTANFPNLTVLNLGQNDIRAEGAKYLSAANFSNLIKLWLGNNNIKQPNKTQLRLLLEQKNIENVYL